MRLLEIVLVIEKGAVMLETDLKDLVADLIAGLRAVADRIDL